MQWQIQIGINSTRTFRDALLKLDRRESNLQKFPNITHTINPKLYVRSAWHNYLFINEKFTHFECTISIQ